LISYIGSSFTLLFYTMKITFNIFNFLFLISLSISLTNTECLAQKPKKIIINDEVNINESLPLSYKQRTFIKGLAGFVNNIDQLVGTLVLIDESKTEVLTRYVRQDKPPIVTSSTSDIIYSAKIDHQFEANGSYSIASAQINNQSINELIITDIGVAFLPEEYIPYLEICKASKNVKEEVKKRIYYVRSSKLTTVYSKAYRMMDINSALNGIIFSVGGKIYGSSEQYKVDYIVSVDLVSLENLISLHNCDEIIQNYELTTREAAEKARLEAAKAEEEKKARESELNSAKAMVEELKKQLSKTTEQSEELKKQFELAQEKEKKAVEDLSTAKIQSQDLKTKAQDAQDHADTQENIIVTFKNKTGEVLEVKNLKELSPEKLKELGFDVDILKEKK